MRIEEQKDGQVTVVGLTGRLDAATSAEVEKRLLKLIGAGERRLLLDLTGLEYVASVGLRVLIVATKRLQSVDGRIVLCGLSQPVMEVFDIAGFTNILGIVASREDAMKELA